MEDNHSMLAFVKIHGRERKSTTYFPWIFMADNTLLSEYRKSHLRVFPHSASTHSVFRKIQIKSNNQLRIGLGLHLSLESTSANQKWQSTPFLPMKSSNETWKKVILALHGNALHVIVSTPRPTTCLFSLVCLLLLLDITYNDISVKI